MRQSERKSIANIIAVNRYIYEWQAEIDKEQDLVIGDLVSPAEKVVKKLIELDNRRIDLCNLKVLYGIIERGLGADFSALISIAMTCADDVLFDRAAGCIARVGYDVDRVDAEFMYLFKRLPKKRAVRAVRADARELCVRRTNIGSRHGVSTAACGRG